MGVGVREEYTCVHAWGRKHVFHPVCAHTRRHVIANPPQNNDSLNGHIQTVINARSKISQSNVAYAHELVQCIKLAEMHMKACLDTVLQF